MKPKSYSFLRSLWFALPLAVVTGCAPFIHQVAHRQASSVVEFLYPADTDHIEQPQVPVLSLPLKVGVAFVPAKPPETRGHMFRGDYSQFTEKQKMTLIKEVSDQFKMYPFVQSIQLIPSAYLSPRGGFANLDQIRSMFGVDVIALLSYDQVQFRDEGLQSLTYWTIVGAYVIPAEKNETQTMMDAVVFDLKSRKLLFRAPGLSTIKNSATPVNLPEKLRFDSEGGFKEAASNLVTSLQEQLAAFKDEIKRSPEEFKIVTRPGYTASAGSFGFVEVVLLVGFCALGFATRKPQEQHNSLGSRPRTFLSAATPDRRAASEPAQTKPRKSIDSMAVVLNRPRSAPRQVRLQNS